MENISKAFIMAFSMLMFVMGFSYSMYLINGLTTTSNTLLSSVNTTNYYDNIKVSGENTTKREVGIDTVISTLYRYYKEFYAVKIIKKKNDNTEEIIQLFDVGLEGSMVTAHAYDRTEDKKLRALNQSIYNQEDKPTYLFGAPWNGNTDDSKTRIDYFLNGTKGYINNRLVDYSGTGPMKGGFIEQYGDKVFQESFIEYAYKGETISTDQGVETITGNTQENSKIMITYMFEE